VKAVLDILFGSVLIGMLFTACGSRILNLKVPKKVSTILMFIALVVTVFLSCLYLDNAFKVMAIYVVTVLLNKVLFDSNAIQCAVTALISYLILTSGELFASILVSLATSIGIITIEDITKGNIFINLLVTLSAYLVLLLAYRKLRKLIVNVKSNNKLLYIFAFSFIMIATKLYICLNNIPRSF